MQFHTLQHNREITCKHTDTSRKHRKKTKKMKLSIVCSCTNGVSLCVPILNVCLLVLCVCMCVMYRSFKCSILFNVCIGLHNQRCMLVSFLFNIYRSLSSSCLFFIDTMFDIHLNQPRYVSFAELGFDINNFFFGDI